VEISGDPVTVSKESVPIYVIAAMPWEGRDRQGEASQETCLIEKMKLPCKADIWKYGRRSLPVHMFLSCLLIKSRFFCSAKRIFR